MATDIRFSSENSVFGVPPAKLGLVYPLADTQRLLNTIGPGATKDLLFSGRSISAHEAFRIQLVDKLVQNEDVLKAARNYAEMLCENSQYSIRGAKRMILELRNGPTFDYAKKAENLFVDSVTAEDFQVGYRAFSQQTKSSIHIQLNPLRFDHRVNSHPFLKSIT